MIKVMRMLIFPTRDHFHVEIFQHLYSSTKNIIADSLIYILQFLWKYKAMSLDICMVNRNKLREIIIIIFKNDPKD